VSVTTKLGGGSLNYRLNIHSFFMGKLLSPLGGSQGERGRGGREVGGSVWRESTSGD